MTRKEFLDDMIAFYSADPAGRRSIDPKSDKCSTRCRYRGPNGRKCAIGRYIPDEDYYFEMEGKGVCDYNDQFGIKAPDSIAHLGTEFLASVQSLHDCDENWSVDGLSTEGQCAVNKIREEYL